MKKTLSLILALIMVISIFTVGATVSAADYMGTKLQRELVILDQLFDYNAEYILQISSNEFFKDADGGAYEITVAEEDYENFLNKFFVMDDAMLESIRNHYSVVYDEAAGTYTLMAFGGFGGILPKREYLGYKKNGSTYDVYYSHITYGYLRDVLPEGVNEWEYAEELGYPMYIVYDGIAYEGGPDGYYYIKSYDDYGRKYTVEFCDDEYVFEGKVESCLLLLEEELPEGVDVDEYAGDLGYPESIDYNGITYMWDDVRGYYAFAWGDDIYRERTCTVDLTEESLRIISVTDYTDAPATFDGYDSSAVYTDVPVNKWYKDSVDFVVSAGLMKGTSDTAFAPEATMNRAMVVTVLYRLEGEPAVSGETTFEDLSEDWYKDPVAWAQSNGIVLGNSAAEFDPYGEITREQLATILHRYSAKKGYYTDFYGIIEDYPDFENVDDWAVNALDWAVTYGLITGSAEGDEVVLDPLGDATRAQVATILMRFCRSFVM